MVDPRLLPLLDLIAANIAAAVLAEHAQSDQKEERPGLVVEAGAQMSSTKGFCDGDCISGL